MKDEMFDFYKNALSGVITDPLCVDFKNEWRNAQGDKLELVKLSLRQQSIPFVATHCYKKKGVSKKYILSEFDKYINGYTVHDADKVEGYSYGLYVDWDYDTDLIVDKDVSHIMWSVGATLFVPETTCPIIYISNKSNVHLVMEGYNTVKIYLFDESRVTIEECDDDSEVTIYKYNEKCKVEYGRYCFSTKIHEHFKELKL